MTVIKLEARAVDLLRAAVLFAATDDVRFYLNAVYIETDPTAGRARIVATNRNHIFVGVANVLESIKASYTLPAASILLSSVDLKAVLATIRAADRRRAYSLEISYDEAELGRQEWSEDGTGLLKAAARFTLESAELVGKKLGIVRRDYDKTARLVEGKYPDYRRAIPAPNKCVSPAAVATFNADLLAASCKAAALLNESKTVWPHIRLYSTGSAGAQFTALSGDALAVIMPMRGGDQEGEEYTAAHNAIFGGLE